MDINAIYTLLERSKTEESIALLDNLSVGTLVGFKPRVVILSGRLTRYTKDKADSIPPSEHINEIHKSILSIAMEMNDSTAPENEINQLLGSSLLLQNSFPFIDRNNFRERITKKLSTDRAHIFLVQGKAKSGMSHLGRFLKHLSENLKIITLIPCDIPQILDEPNMNLGEKLAKYISFSLNMEAKFDENENAQFKFIQFINRLKTKIKSENKIPLFFLHDFHKINDGNENLLEFIFMLINSINSDFPKSIFIIAGLNYENLRNWHNDLRFTTEIYNMEAAGIEDLEKCLLAIFNKYCTEIQKVLNADITKDEYVEHMKNVLVTNGQTIDINAVGEALSNHLFTLKN